MTDRSKMGKSPHHGSLGLHLDSAVGQSEGNNTNHSDVHEMLLDIDAVDMSIIKEWHAGSSSNNLIPMDGMQFKGSDLEILLTMRSQFCQDWLSLVQKKKAYTYSGRRD
jgi:hypothetical protein